MPTAYYTLQIQPSNVTRREKERSRAQLARSKKGELSHPNSTTIWYSYVLRTHAVKQKYVLRADYKNWSVASSAMRYKGLLTSANVVLIVLIPIY